MVISLVVSETKDSNGTASLEGDLLDHLAAVLAKLHGIFLSVCYMRENGVFYMNIILKYVFAFFLYLHMFYDIQPLNIFTKI